MRIKELMVKDMFSFHDARVEFAADRPIALFFGQNGSGKTSLRHIIEVLLTADVQDLDGTKINLERLRQAGADKGGVQGVIERPGKEDLTVRRTVTGKGISTRVNGHDNPGDISDHLGGALQPDLLYRALANATGFFQLKAANQKALLLSLIPQDIPDAALAGLPLGNEWVAKPKTLDDLDLAYKNVYERRTLKKAELARTPAPTNEVLNRWPVDMQDIENRLNGIVTEKDLLLQQSGEIIATARSLDQQIETLKGLVAEADFELAAFASAGTLVAEADRAEAQYIAQDQQATAWKTGQDQIVEESRRVQALASARTKLEGIDGLCVIGGGVACPMGPGAKKDAGESLQGRIDTATATIAEIRQRIGAAPDVSGTRKALGDARNAVKERDAWQKKRDDAVQGIADIEPKLAAVKAQAVADEEKLATLQGRIRKGHETRDRALTINREHAAAQQAKALRDALVPEIEALERLVVAFGPKGIRERLLVERVANMVGAVNATLAAFNLTMSFTDDPFEVRINGMPAALMAESEQFRAGVAFQVALATATGMRFMVVDGADVLDGPNRRALWATLQKATTEKMVDQVIVTATYSTAAPPKETHASIGAYHITRSDAGSIISPLTV